MKQEIVLGICDNHDAGAVLFIGGKLHGAINEERLNRVKFYQGFPDLSIDHVLKSAGVSPGDVDAIVVASEMTPAFLLRMLRKAHAAAKSSSSQFGSLLRIYVWYQVLADKLFFPRKIEKLLSYVYFRMIFLKKGYHCGIRLIDHHVCHAYGAFLTSGFPEAIIITMDAMGDGVGITVNVGKGDSVQTVFRQSGFNAPGFFYSRITEILGFQPNNHEGKITGLAAYGDPSVLHSILGKMFSFEKGKIRISQRQREYLALKKYKREDVAAAAQLVFENTIREFVEFWIDKTSVDSVCLSGGVFSNVKLNQRIHQSSKTKSIYIFPHMGDGGLALGAALSYLRPRSCALTDLFLGPEIKTGAQEISELLSRYQLVARKTDRLENTVADLLAAGKLVAVCRGKQEFGPRALGNHSILCKTDDPGLNAVLNAKLKRTEFMPFAPMTLDVFASQCYDRLEGAEHADRFMTITFDCTPFMKEKSPCVVHIDGTARPQIVRKEDNPFIYAILSAYQQMTGIPSILNTSFNIHEEPIVFSACDALKTFVNSGIDYLVLGELLITRKWT